VARTLRKGTIIHYWWKCKLVQPVWKAVSMFQKEVNTELPHDPAMSLLVIYLNEGKSAYIKETYTPMFL
jgi:hypothetical protein